MAASQTLREIWRSIQLGLLGRGETLPRFGPDGAPGDETWAALRGAAEGDSEAFAKAVLGWIGAPEEPATPTVPRLSIRNHLLEGVRYIASPNVSPGTIKPRFAVMHYTGSWTIESAIATLTRRGSEVSAPIVIGRDGEIVQLVPFNRRSWHAGPSRFRGYEDLNSHSIGIEFVNPGWIKEGPDGGYSQGPVHIPADRLDGYDLSVRKPHPRLGTGSFVWPGYTEAQIRAGLAVLAAIHAEYRLEGVCSHEEIDTRGWKTDPGFAFPMDRFAAVLSPSNGV